ncbi:MAG: phenylalanine--tRNA ligase subunit alpha [Oscillospiraceae bacterium]|nr:phenylalanine--tRNA ligase subunit alpha [Oscillospiraceae bacterium]
MKEQLEKILQNATKELEGISDLKAMEDLRIRFLGKKGELTGILKQMGGLSPEERPVMGQLANSVRSRIEQNIAEKTERLRREAAAAKLAAEKIDVTLPGNEMPIGRAHPLNAVLAEVEEVFLGMGFDIVDGPEVETDHYCFEALNMPKSHPARDTQDTFYISDNVVLRTQTSSVQIRTMEQRKPPIRIISPGRVYRSDAVDATHSPLFHQIEGLVIDKGITLADLYGTLDMLMKKLYGKDTQIRLRPHHFPYTEPSAEVDLMCFNCGGKGCSMCKNEGYVELLGAGMVHPKVLERCGIDPEVYSGFAFGIGLERITMGRYGINDMRLLYENDMRFLGQF